MHADLIVLLVDGQVVERGTHDELMARSGRYRGMVEMQMGNRPRPAANRTAPASV